jgi:hypothetical protein
VSLLDKGLNLRGVPLLKNRLSDFKTPILGVELREMGHFNKN